MKLNWNFLGGWGLQNKNPTVGEGGMDISGTVHFDKICCLWTIERTLQNYCNCLYFCALFSALKQNNNNDNY